MPEVDGDKPKRSRFAVYPLGHVHINPAEVRTAEGRLYLFVAIDRTTKFAGVALHEKATRRVAGDVLRHPMAVPYTVLTDPDLGGNATTRRVTDAVIPGDNV